MSTKGPVPTMFDSFTDFPWKLVRVKSGAFSPTAGCAAEAVNTADVDNRSNPKVIVRYFNIQTVVEKELKKIDTKR